MEELNILTNKEEQSFILESLVYEDIYPRLKEKNIVLELFITPNCNKNCSYCYLQKNKDYLYPKEIRNKETILLNLKIFLNHLIEKKVAVNQIDLFSGDIWDTGFGKAILLTILEYLDKGLQVKNILIPTNGSFLNNENDYFFYSDLIDNFNKKSVNLIFSFSNDGKIIDSINRPFNNQEYQCNYDNLFSFANENFQGFHPMIDANEIEKQIENLYWWESEFEKHNFHIGKNIMFLEVRDDKWTDEKIYSYLQWLKAFSDLIYNSSRYFNKNTILYLEELTSHIFKEKNNKEKKFFNFYSPLGLRHYQNRMSCNITQGYNIRLGDLSIIPCHRTAYSKLIYGKYKVENSKITGIENNNYYYALINWIGGQNNYIKCSSCPINSYCIKGCQGAQYESFKEPLYPIEENCNLQKAKIIFNIYNYIYYLNKLNEQEYSESFTKQFQLCKDLLIKLQEENGEFYQKWITKIEKMFIEK